MEGVLHKIRVNLYENLLTDNSNDYSAKVISECSLNVKEICQMAVKRGGAATTAEAMKYNVMLFLKEMAYQLMDGYSINTEYFVANAQVRGVFDSPNEQFDPKKHSLLFRFNQGEILRKEIPNVAVQVMGVGNTDILISQIVDTKTGSVNNLITPNGNLRIKGGRLKITGEDPQVGVYFKRENEEQTVRIESNDIVVNNPSELIVVIPQLEKGRYQLVVCNQYGGNSQQLLKTPRTTVFERVLTVE